MKPGLRNLLTTVVLAVLIVQARRRRHGSDAGKGTL